jgi:ferritin-like protein
MVSGRRTGIMIPKVFPRNLTARASVQVIGNPVTTRLESGVGNCFPGLEFDHRNLDRRFFPGLVLEFTANGIRFLEVDLSDPALAEETNLKQTLAGDIGEQLKQGVWFVEKITQRGKTIEMPKQGQPLDVAMASWRLVRCLEPGTLAVQLRRRQRRDEGQAESGPDIKLTAKRRTYVDPQTGVINGAYRAGELTQSLCSPWMHDFRDCACYYWASNHPDIVLSEDPPGEPTLPSGAPTDPVLALTPIDWLRRDRKKTDPAQADAGADRQEEIDHYEINQNWQNLAIVLRGREISGIYRPRASDPANPFDSPDQLAEQLTKLATLEHAVALEYLYARYSLKDPLKVMAKTLKDDLTFVWHEILLVAVSEMRHLRWANQLIWSLEHAGLLTRPVGPSLGIAEEIPVAVDTLRPPQLPPLNSDNLTRPRQLRPLRPDVLQDFISVEQPSGFLDGQYSRVLATLSEKKYPETLEQLAARIIGDGMDHFTRFREIQGVLEKYKKPEEYLRELQPAPAGHLRGDAALKLYAQITHELQAAYAKGNMEDAAHIAAARGLMFELDRVAKELAAEGFGVQFFPASRMSVVRPAGKKRAKRGTARI